MARAKKKAAGPASAGSGVITDPEKVLEEVGELDGRMVEGGPPGRTVVTISGDALSKAADMVRGQLPGQPLLPGMPKPGSFWRVAFKGSARRVGFGKVRDEAALGDKLGPVRQLFDETTTRVCAVIVRAVDSDEALETGRRRIEAMVGGLTELFADYPGEPAGQSWTVTPSKEP